MPTLTTPTLDQLAVLIAVEREATRAFRSTAEDRREAVVTAGASSDKYADAVARDQAACDAMMSARVEVDMALTALAGIEVAA